MLKDQTTLQTVSSAVTRFVCPYDGKEYSTLDDLKAHIETDHMQKDSESGMVSLTVNGRVHKILIKPNQTLWYVLRDKLGITSPKDMCNGYGACGSCTVIINGRPVLSCMTLAIECDGANIETAEGIADAGHPLIEAYTELYAMQCGYCTPGFVVTAKALLDRIPRPTEADIRDALGGNICKCSTYPAHIRAVLVAAQELWEKNHKPNQVSG
ncbi:MAG TPA: (2Fe-2S)-binding protein [Dehalococcoidales bacterium]|nr:(2Fe-2S)-binding protein [Dehalococcoidales bacterium]